MPQGCVLGPILFKIYVDDLFKLPIQSNLIAFADDTKIYNLSCNHGILQKDLSILYEWCKKNSVFVNFEKTVVMRFGARDSCHPYILDGCVLTEASEVKDLGVLIDSKLSYATHCSGIVRKAQRLNYVILKVFSHCSAQNKFFLFKCYVRPLLDYCMVLYYPKTQNLKTMLETVQRRFTKRICDRGLGYKERLNYLSDTTIEQRHRLFSLLIMYKIVYGLLDICGFSYATSSLPSRGSIARIRLPDSRTNFRKSFPLIHFVQLWNSLRPSPSDLSSVADFKRFLVKISLEARA